MATLDKLTAYAAPDVAIAGATLNALGIGAYAYGAEIDNTSLLHTLGDLTIALPSAVVSVAPAWLTVFLLPNVDGNYAASAGNPGQGYSAGTYWGPGGSVQYFQIPRLPMFQRFKVVIQNNLGVALPASNAAVCSLYRYSFQAV